MNNMKKLILIGTGNICRMFLEMYNFSQYSVIAVCDNDRTKWENRIENYEIRPVTDIEKLDYDYICITCDAFDQINSQLINMGVKSSLIVDFSFLRDYKLITQNDVGRNIISGAYKCIRNTEAEEVKRVKKVRRMQELHMILSAQILASGYKGKKIEHLSDVEFRVFSQNGEDGIIQWIIQNSKIENKIFVEFGVENYEESNTRFLLMNDNWSGIVMDGDKENIKSIISWDEYWRYNLTAKECFITKENINGKIREEGIEGEIGLLSVDVDGNDYWILDSITCIDPTILICEYNSIWGGEKRVTIPYEATFQRTNKHYSNLYYGASLRAFTSWAENKGYLFLGCNSAGNNAFFVKKDSFDAELLLGEASFVMGVARESRDQQGKLTFLPANKRLNLVKELSIYDIDTNEEKCIKDLYQL